MLNGMIELIRHTRDCQKLIDDADESKNIYCISAIQSSWNWFGASEAETFLNEKAPVEFLNLQSFITLSREWNV